MSRKRKEHPANLFNKARHHAFSVYEKTNDFDKALNTLKAYRLFRPLKVGLEAELLFYHNYREPLKLEPLLDAGVKADFAGMKGNKMVNIDVTTNLDYKDINKYAELTQSRKKTYEIALVRKEETNFFPLRFPICPSCGRFSHYIVFMSRPSSQIYWFASTGQVLVHYCPFCDHYDYGDAERYDFIINSVLVHLEDKQDEQRYVETMDPHFSREKYVLENSIPIVQFFESQTQKLISALFEGDYIITDPRDADGYYGGKVLWTHPLVRRYIEDTIDFSYYDGETRL